MIIKYKTKKTPLKRGGCNIMNLNVRFFGGILFSEHVIFI